MGVVEWLEKAGSIVTALLAIFGFIVGFFKILRKLSMMADELKKLVDHDSEQYLSILRLTVMSNEMPISERVIAGRKYIDAGGNGAVKKYYDEYLAHLHEEKEE